MTTMTVWAEIPGILALTSDEELVRMRAYCRVHYRKFERGPERERQDARKMFDMIKAEQRRRLLAPARTALIQ